MANRFICSGLRAVLAPAADDFERIIKVWAKCCPGIFYMLWKRDGMEKRPAILITAGITAPWASLSVQQCNHQPSTCNARAAVASPGEGREGEEGGERADTEQMDNVSSATVLQPVMNLRLNTADWILSFADDTPQLKNYLYNIIILSNICSVLEASYHFL